MTETNNLVSQPPVEALPEDSPSTGTDLDGMYGVADTIEETAAEREAREAADRQEAQRLTSLYRQLSIRAQRMRGTPQGDELSMFIGKACEVIAGNVRALGYAAMVDGQDSTESLAGVKTLPLR